VVPFPTKPLFSKSYKNIKQTCQNSSQHH
jgi:hypothetical protein